MDTSVDDWTYYTYNIENQLTIEETGGTATYYTYNPVGELIGKKVDGTEYTYDYTFEGQMNVFSDGATNAYYTYDSDFRRVEKKVDGVKTKYEYSGDDVVAEYDESDILQVTFNTPALDQNLTQKRSGNIYHYLQDGLGSVRNIIDANEAVQNTYDYAAFGSVYGSPTENVTNRYRFTAREWESIPSLHFYRARMMDQTLGRFLSKDPYGYVALGRINTISLLEKCGASIGCINFYRYVQNNPMVYSDPQGLNEKKPNEEGKPCYCGPDLTGFLARLVKSAFIWRKRWRQALNVPMTGVSWMFEHKMDFDWTADQYATEKAGIRCPSFGICQQTYELFGECVHDHWIGNFMIGLLGCIMGVPRSLIHLAGETASISSPDNPLKSDPAWDKAGYDLGIHVCNKIIQGQKDTRSPYHMWLTETILKHFVVGEKPDLWAKSNNVNVATPWSPWFWLFPYPEPQADIRYKYFCKLCPHGVDPAKIQVTPGSKLGSEWPKYGA